MEGAAGDQRLADLDVRDVEHAIAQAYKSRDVELSVAGHKLKHQLTQSTSATTSEENHVGGAGDFVKSLVFGGLDGISTTFAIVAAGHGGGLPKRFIVLMGCAELVADAISMGVGDFLSEKEEIKHVQEEKKREQWEMNNYLEGEKAEMVELYKAKGVCDEDARSMIETMAKYKELFLNHMMVMELGLMPVDEDDSLKKGLVTFLAFMVFGAVPVATTACMMNINVERGFDWTFAVVCFATVFTFFSLGAFKGHLMRQQPFIAGLQMVINGTGAAGCAYAIGYGLQVAMDIHGCQ